MKVAIIGGGIGGMSLALSLHAAGFDDVDIYESASAVRELGVGINVLPHAVRELTEIDLLDELSRAGVATADFTYFSSHGQPIWQEPGHVLSSGVRMTTTSSTNISSLLRALGPPPSPR